MTWYRDIWCAPVNLTTSNYSFRVNENGGGGAGVQVVTVSTGLAYPYNGSISGYTSLYSALATALNSACNGTWSFLVEDPVQSSGQAGGTIQIKNTIDFEISWDHASMTMDERWFGFRRDVGTLSTSNTIGASGTGPYTVTGDFMCLPRWYSANIIDNVASRKHPDRDKIVERSTQNTADASTLTWKKFKTRDFLYELVPGPHVHGHKGASMSSTMQTLATLADGDACNGWDFVWDALTAGYPVLVEYDAQTPSLGMSNYEIVKLRGNGGALRSQAPFNQGAADLYDIALAVEVISGTYEVLDEGDYLA